MRLYVSVQFVWAALPRGACSIPHRIAAGNRLTGVLSAALLGRVPTGSSGAADCIGSIKGVIRIGGLLACSSVTGEFYARVTRVVGNTRLNRGYRSPGQTSCMLVVTVE